MDRTGIFFCLLLCVICWLHGACIIGETATNRYQQEAINRGYAQHNPTTGQWEWIEPEE